MARSSKKPLRASNETSRNKNRAVADMNRSARRGRGPITVPKPAVRLAPNNPAGTKGTGKQSPSKAVAAMLGTPIQRSERSIALRTKARGR